jgi:hypothetical protein
MLVTFVTLIPLSRNDGTPVTDDEQEAILDRLIAVFGRLTIEGTVMGVWKDEKSKKTYRDKSLKIAIGCPWNRAAEFEALIKEIGKELDQKEMFLEVRSGTGIQSLKCEA